MLCCPLLPLFLLLWKAACLLAVLPESPAAQEVGLPAFELAALFEEMRSVVSALIIQMSTLEES